jgi:hypothetical protein
MILSTDGTVRTKLRVGVFLVAATVFAAGVVTGRSLGR